jgi:hypothetical protein
MAAYRERHVAGLDRRVAVLIGVTGWAFVQYQHVAASIEHVCNPRALLVLAATSGLARIANHTTDATDSNPVDVDDITIKAMNVIA